jgi:hypothetical protein
VPTLVAGVPCPWAAESAWVKVASWAFKLVISLDPWTPGWSSTGNPVSAAFPEFLRGGQRSFPTRVSNFFPNRMMTSCQEYFVGSSSRAFYTWMTSRSKEETPVVS